RPELREALALLASRQRASMYMVLLAGFQSLVARYAGIEDVVVGSPVAGRTHGEVEGLIGFFVNTLVMRTDLSGDPPFTAIVARARETALGAYAQQDLPFEQLVEAVAPVRDLSRNPLFQLMLNLLNTPEVAQEAGDLRVSMLAPRAGSALFDLQVYVAESTEGIATVWEYATDLFEAATIARLAGHFGTLLEGAASRSEARLSALPMLAVAERNQLLSEWNATDRALPDGRVHEAILALAQRDPDRLAVIADGEGLTWGELEQRVNRLARRLRRLGVGPGVLVGVVVERTLGLPVAVLGVLAAGGAYVPLDPGYPEERLAYMAKDSAIAVLVTQAGLAPRIAGFHGEIVELAANGRLAGAIEDPESEMPLPTVTSPLDLAYVIYTSGSTGRPKGVEVPHRALWNFLRSMLESPGISAEDVFVSVTSLSFDIAGLEIYGSLLAGARLVIATREEAIDGTLLARLLAASGATLLQATPAGWRVLLESGWAGSADLTALCGGEALAPALAAALLPRTRQLWNLYGPTETAIWSTIERVETAEPITIGRPIANTQVHVVGGLGGLVPVGVLGELSIGGVGVVRGYHGRPDLTAERLVPDPFAGSEGSSGAGGERL